MDKITEEVITSLIKRIENLEAQRPIKQNNSEIATDGQKKYLKALGGNPWPNMTKSEASHLIDKLLKNKNKKEETNQPENDLFESRPLSQDAIDEIGEENLM